MRVRVYWNFNRKLWSVVNCKTGLVCAHRRNLTLSNVKFVVQPGGRARVLRERVKNIHAFAVGELTDLPDMPRIEVPIGYNPYKNGHFYSKDTGTLVIGADRVDFHEDGEVFATMVKLFGIHPYEK